MSDVYTHPLALEASPPTSLAPPRVACAVSLMALLLYIWPLGPGASGRRSLSAAPTTQPTTLAAARRPLLTTAASMHAPQRPLISARRPLLRHAVLPASDGSAGVVVTAEPSGQRRKEWSVFHLQTLLWSLAYGVALPVPRPPLPGHPLTGRPASPPGFEPLLPPRSALGQHLLETAVRMPHLFKKSVRNALRRMNETEAAYLESHAHVSMDAELYSRIREVRAVDCAQALQDVMYLDVLFNFHSAGVRMLTPRYLDDPARLPPVGPYHRPDPVLFSPDALELIEARMPCLLGMLSTQASSAPLAPLYTCKYHVAQLYAGSALFGYFLRRANKRFALAKSTGVVSPVLTFDETISLLSDMYLSAPAADANHMEPDRAAPLQSPPKPRGRSVTLKEHLESLHPEITMQMMQMSSLEASHVLQSHTRALLGDLEALQRQLLAVLQDTAAPPEADMLTRLRGAVQARRVDVVRLQESDHRWLVMEAIHFGAHLRDVEDEVKAVQQCALLTPNRPEGGGGDMHGGSGGDNGGGGDGPPAPPPPGPGGESAAAR
eukprot:EG_transcript_5813